LELQLRPRYAACFYRRQGSMFSRDQLTPSSPAPGPGAVRRGITMLVWPRPGRQCILLSLTGACWVGQLLAFHTSQATTINLMQLRFCFLFRRSAAAARSALGAACTFVAVVHVGCRGVAACACVRSTKVLPDPCLYRCPTPSGPPGATGWCGMHRGS
jgi:hypothetical protein